MDIRVGDRVRMKKKHPCGSDSFVVLYTGVDLKLQCSQCGRIVLLPRDKGEARIRSLTREEEQA